MSANKKAYLCLTTYALALLLVCFIVNKIAQNVVLSLISILSTVSVVLLIKKRKAPELQKNQVTLVMAAVAVIMIVIYLLLGTKLGFQRADPTKAHLATFALPFAATVVSTEIARSILLAQKSRNVMLISFVLFVTVDTLLLSDVYMFLNFESFVEVLTLALFPAVTSNILYHYLAAKYGALPGSVYKALIFLYPYMIPYRPQISDALLSYARIFLPIGILLLVHTIYTPKTFAVSRMNTRLRTALTCVAMIVSVLYIMLISSQFRYGLLVIATESMEGVLEKGDAVIYEKYDDQMIQNGQIIVFEKDDARIIHRVVEIKKINGQMRYFTKGDANESMDSGYITDAQIVGVIRTKIKYIGLPTLWGRWLFDN